MVHINVYTHTHAQFEEMLTLALRSEDELFHVTLYSWLMSVGLSERLIEVSGPHLHHFQAIPLFFLFIIIFKCL